MEVLSSSAHGLKSLRTKPIASTQTSNSTSKVKGRGTSSAVTPATQKTRTTTPSSITPPDKRMKIEHSNPPPSQGRVGGKTIGGRPVERTTASHFNVTSLPSNESAYDQLPSVVLSEEEDSDSEFFGEQLEQELTEQQPINNDLNPDFEEEIEVFDPEQINNNNNNNELSNNGMSATIAGLLPQDDDSSSSSSSSDSDSSSSSSSSSSSDSSESSNET